MTASPPAEKKPASKRFFYIRVGILLSILAGVLLWAWRDVRRRHARNDWDHTLDVAIVLVRLETIDDTSIALLESRLPALEDRMTDEQARYRPRTPHPFRFKAVGPVDAAAPPPMPVADGVVDVAKHSLALTSWMKEIDGRAGLDEDLYDVRVYVALRRPRQVERTLVEGRGEQGGRTALVEVELDPDGVDFALIVAAHELMHTLGAADKYDDQGRARVPEGLAEPNRVPLYPQVFAELMARNRPISPGNERVPSSFAEVAIGATTAREIGWTK